MLQLVVLEEEPYKMTQAVNKTPLAEHARVLGGVVAKLELELELEHELEALARMPWMISVVAAASLLVMVEEEARSLHSPFFVAEVEVEAASLCAMLLV
jgi:hypothetical protein